MPILNWIGKKAIIEHHKHVPFRFLKRIETRSVGTATNMLIEGDNLMALKSLLPYYKEKIKCIYIDPPYNTGEENWIYNDNVNSPQIKKWLGKTVGKEGEDLTRHDKWLCMMYPRLVLLRDLLSKDGVIFVSVGKDELTHLVLLLSEIFKEVNYIDTISREQKSGSNYGNLFSPQLDYVVVAAKNKKCLEPFRIDKKERAHMVEKSLYQASLDIRPNQRYWIRCPDNSFIIPPGTCFPSVEDGEKIKPENPDDRVWRWSQTRYLANKNELVFKKTRSSPLINEHRKNSEWNVYEVKTNSTEMTPRDYIFGYTNSLGTKELKELGFGRTFQNPKPTELIKYIVSMLKDDGNMIVLDSFAGSGTTAHAVLDLNKEDGGNRKFILIELESKIAKNIMAKRISKVIKNLGGGGRKTALPTMLLAMNCLINMA